MNKWLPGVLTRTQMPTVKTKTLWPKKPVTVRHFALQSTVLEMARYTAESQAAVNEKSGRWTEPLQITEVWLSTDSRYSKAAEAMCAYQKWILVQKKSSVIGGRRIFLTKMCYYRRQGYLPKLVTKMNEMPTTFVSLVVKRNCSDGQRPSPLWEFREANCFRDLIVAQQNENPRWSGLSYLNRITGTRRSVAKIRIDHRKFALLVARGYAR